MAKANSRKKSCKKSGNLPLGSLRGPQQYWFPSFWLPFGSLLSLSICFHPDAPVLFLLDTSTYLRSGNSVSFYLGNSSSFYYDLFSSFLSGLFSSFFLSLSAFLFYILHSSPSSYANTSVVSYNTLFAHLNACCIFIFLFLVCRTFIFPSLTCQTPISASLIGVFLPKRSTLLLPEDEYLVEGLVSLLETRK